MTIGSGFNFSVMDSKRSLTSVPSLLDLTKSEQYRRVLHYIATSGSSVPRLCFQAIRCTHPNCPCECFSPGKVYLRSCDTCKHGWVAHALDKLGYRHIYNLGMSVEVVQPNIVFDIASLMLYGAHATPIRLKILLDRLFSVLQHDEVLQVLQGFGWTYEDYARGYILQDASGQVLDKWTVASREEEHVILQQFLRFGETKSIAQEIILQDTKDQQELFLKQTSRSDSEIKKFIERNNHTMQSYMRSLESRHLFPNRMPFLPVGNRLLSPVSLTSFSPTSSSSRELRPPVVTAGMTTSSPGSTSPLGRLQTMQPFDFRRDQSSPAISPTIPDKQNAGSSPIPSPKHLSSTPSSSKSISPPFTPAKSLDSREHTPVPMATNPMTLPVMPPQDEQGGSAIDYSTNKESPGSPNSSFYADRKMKHLRKSSNPVKRQWNPSPGFGTTLVGPNGKKRVLCTACNKTFCDKGALKIHYSAVHLKEMHKCTVDGCNMMFSSRRSRNRHSANPNPKLHMPQKRVKLPDGASVIDDGSNKAIRRVTSPPTMVIPPTLGPHGTIPPLDSQELHPSSQAAFFAELNAQMSVFPTPEKRYKLYNCDEGPKDLSMPDKRESRIDSDDESSIDFDREEEDLGKRDSPSHQRSFSRRKNNIPTRCTQADDNFALSDDNSDKERESTKHPSKEEQYIHRRKRIAETDDHTGSSSPVSNSHRYFLNLSHSDEERVDTSMDTSNEEGSGGTDQRENAGLPSKDFPKIASLLSKSGQGQELEAIDYSTTKHREDDSNSLSSDVSQVSNSEASNGALEEIVTNGDVEDEAVSLDIPLDKDNPKTVSTHYHQAHSKVSNHQLAEDNHTYTSSRSRKKRNLHSSIHKKLFPAIESADSNDGMADDEKEPNDESMDAEDEENHKPINGKNGDDNHGNLANHCDEEEELMEDDTMGSESGKELNEICLDENEISVHCHICQSKFKDNLALKEHFEINHPKEMFNCTVKGCGKIFSTRKSRNRHSQNDNLHRHLSSGKQSRIS